MDDEQIELLLKEIHAIRGSVGILAFFAVLGFLGGVLALVTSVAG